MPDWGDIFYTILRGRFITLTYIKLNSIRENYSVPSGVKSPHVTVLLWPANVFIKTLRSAFHIHMLQSSDPAIIRLCRICHLSHYKTRGIKSIIKYLIYTV
jgi:hypothetical protein